MKYISGKNILAAFKTYEDIRVSIFNDRVEKACCRFGARTEEKIEEFRENKECECSCIRFSDLKKILSFCYKKSLNQVDNNEEIFFECCNKNICEYTHMDLNHYLVKPDDRHLQLYSHINTFVKPVSKNDDSVEYGNRIYVVACIMLYIDCHDSLTFFSELVWDTYDGNEESQDFVDKGNRFIRDFGQALMIFFGYVYNTNMTKKADAVRTFAKEFFMRVSKHKGRNLKSELYSENFEI